MLDACSPYSPYKEVWIMKSSRSGVTTAIAENLIGYHIDIDPGPILYAAPAKENASKFSRKNFTPMIRDNPALRGRVPLARSRDGNNTIFFKMFPGGVIQFAWSTSDKCFRGDTMRVVICDDVDAFSTMNREGDPVALAFRRSVTLWNRMNVAISNPTIAGLSIIETGYGNSNQGHYYVPCPRCKHYQVLVFSKNSIFAKPTNGSIVGSLVTGYEDSATGETKLGLQFDKDNCTWCYYICENCSVKLTESDKYPMLLKGQWRFVNPNAPAEIAGFHISELYSTLESTWLDICRGFLVAHKSAERLKVWINNSLGESFEYDTITVSDHLLLERIEDYTAIPRGCYLLTAGCDVQSDRLEAAVWGWGPDDQTWLIEHQIFYGNPHDQLVFDRLHDYLLKQFKHIEGGSLRITCTFVDSSYDTQQIYKFTASREQRGIYAIKGFDGKRDNLIKITKRDKRTHALLFMLAVDQAKDKLYDRLGKQAAGPGYIHLNKFATLSFVQQLTAEKRVRRINKKGFPVIQWMLPSGKQNHALDMTIYAYCAKEFLSPINWKRVQENFYKRSKSEPDKSKDEPVMVDAQPQRAAVRSRIIKKGSYWR